MLKNLKDAKEMILFFNSTTIPLKMAKAPIPKCSAKLLFFYSPIILRKFIIILSRFFKNTCEGELRFVSLLNRCSYNFSKISEKHLRRISFLANYLRGETRVSDLFINKVTPTEITST